MKQQQSSSHGLPISQNSKSISPCILPPPQSSDVLIFLLGGGVFVQNGYQAPASFGEGDGSPLQYSCLENPMDGGAYWGREESDTTERLHFQFSLSCAGVGNSNPLQCSCLENPRDGGAWWTAVYEVTESWTRLK